MPASCCGAAASRCWPTCCRSPSWRRRYEADGGLSFRGFVDELRDAADRAPAPEAPILEEGTDGVRLMTVHKAKGLEFPVVILADIGCKLSRDDAQRYLDTSRELAAIKLAGWTPLDLRENNALEASRDKAEGVRLAYVAATRAKDLLVVPAIGDGPEDKHWVQPLSAALYGGDETTVPGVPAFTRQGHASRSAAVEHADAAHDASGRLRAPGPDHTRALRRRLVGSAAARSPRRRTPRHPSRTPDPQGRAGPRSWRPTAPTTTPGAGGGRRCWIAAPCPAAAP